MKLCFGGKLTAKLVTFSFIYIICMYAINCVHSFNLVQNHVKSKSSKFYFQGCLPDTHLNSSQSHKVPIKKPPPEMLIEITIAHRLCTQVQGFNDTRVCDVTVSLRDDDDRQLQEIHAHLSRFLGVESRRIENFTILGHAILNHTRVQRPTIETNDNISIVELNEYLRVKFLLRDRLSFSTVQDEINEETAEKLTNRETITLFYFMVMHALDKRRVPLLADTLVDTYLSEVSMASSKGERDEDGWCNSRGDQQLTFRDDFRILVRFDDASSPTYYVYVNETNTLYGAGYFQLTFYLTNLARANAKNVFGAFAATQWTFSSDRYQIVSEHYALVANKSDYLRVNLTLTDVTSMFLRAERERGEQTKASEMLESKELLTVCNIAPKIRVECRNLTTIRIKLCELERRKDGTYCSRRTKFCYSIDEYQYEYDTNTTKFIRVRLKLDIFQIYGQFLVLTTI